ncbi:MAG: biotin/lipoate A/B protein ligase family protein [Synechococcales bacterium]|nr:biotin/lipoate A/B protein ligase family protein [Synechococcales bacterium]
MTHWRLIPLLDAPGTMQMAIDSWLLNQHQQGHPPTLRFYTWSPPAISLGVSQRRQVPEHWRSLTWQGRSVELVQRPSGGRGVLHQGDLTYAIVTSQPGLDRTAAYAALCEFLIVGWAKLGIHLQFGQPNRAYLKSQNCFALSTNADLVDDRGRKFIGSAQRLQGSCVLQHGSMLLAPNPDLFVQVFGGEPPEPLFGDRPLTDQIPEIVAALTEAAALCFGAEFEVAALTPAEWAEVCRGNI